MRDLVCKIANLAKLLQLFISRKNAFPGGETLSEEDTQRYESIIGSLMYAMIGTRPDIAFVLSELSKYVSKPGKNHLIAAKRVLR